MSFKKTLAHRLFNSTFRRTPPPPPDRYDVISRYRNIHQSSAHVSPSSATPSGLLQSLRGTGIAPPRIRLEGISLSNSNENVITAEDARKVLRVSQLETVKRRVREIGKDCVVFDEFLEICCEGCGSKELGARFAKMLDESGFVIVLGKNVFLRPEQVVSIVQGLMPSPVAQPDDSKWKELKEMEKQKSSIDRKAESLVRRELWCGLGYLMIQTAVFMRLTFWELTWDVMEPICFYVTSGYFMAGYAFFLRTKIEPSFEGLFLSRFSTKQNRLMKKLDFDLERYNELSRAYYPQTSLHGNASLHVVSSSNI